MQQTVFLSQKYPEADICYDLYIDECFDFFHLSIVKKKTAC